MGLSPRQREVLDLLALGLSTQDIANQLWISKHTVRNHVQQIMDKMGVNSRLAAVHRARVWVDSPAQRIIDWCRTQQFGLSERQEFAIRQVFDTQAVRSFGASTVVSPWVITASYSTVGVDRMTEPAGNE